MPFPAGASTITVTGTFPVPVAGTARAGSIVFTPSAVLVDSTQKAIYSGAGAVALDAQGKFTTLLLCTDDTDVQPAGWRWRVDEQPTGGQRRTYWISLPSTLGPTVDLSALAPVSTPGGTGQSTPPTGPAGGALTGSYPNPSLSAATIASFDPAGAAAAVDAAKLAKSANLSDLGNINTARTNLGLGGAAVLNVGTTAGTVAAGNDSRLSDARTPTAHAASHAGAGSDPVTLTQAQITGLTAALAALAPLAGATFTGPVAVDDANFSVLGTGKGYRFRPLGSRLDCEATGSDWILSVFSGTNFDGTQRTYLRLEAGVTLAHACGTWIFTDTPDSGAVHTLDGSGNKLGFHGATAIAKQTVTGSRGGNAALGSLITALANLGLITDNTTA